MLFSEGGQIQAKYQSDARITAAEEFPRAISLQPTDGPRLLISAGSPDVSRHK
jgi:hypothetical protein